MSRTLWRQRAVIAGVAVGLALPLGGGAGPANAARPHGLSPAQAVQLKVDAKVRDQLAEQGKATAWVVLESKADITGAAQRRTKTEKAAYVYQTKTEHAARTQADIKRLLESRGADFTSYWISNAIRVTADSKLIGELAVRDDVARVKSDDPVALPRPAPGQVLDAINAIEWNIDRVNAPRVWNELGVRGEGIVVANIDTGVDFTHPAVTGVYRGRNPDGTFDHNYNWFDPSSVCSTAAPCDNNGHGTHTMGTMVGLDGENIIGVAPAARWIAAKGCESSSCSESALLASGQWIVAPTDLNGQNPRPDLAPDVVNNSWGGPGFDPFYQDIVNSWEAAGIFPAFSNGNSGAAGCNSSGSPGIYVNSYSSGAFDINNAIAGFSSRGPGLNGDVKPNIAAPGVNVRSSVPGGYASFQGTSMASPHTAATVALMWSASPAIQGDITATRQLIDTTAIDVDNTSCGGTAADNNVWGEGRLDAFAAVNATPRGALGTLSGHVTSGGSALAGATVTVDGPMQRSVTTGADGSYSFDRLMVGTYTATASKFGFVSESASVTINEGENTTQDFDLDAAPAGTLSGTVSTASGPLAGVLVEALGTPVSATTDAAGNYSMTLPQGEYDVRATPPTRCDGPATQHAVVGASTVLNFTLPSRTDQFGYACGEAVTGYTPGTNRLALTGDDASVQVALPFPVPLYGNTYRTAFVSTNGHVNFLALNSSFSNGPIPSAGTPNAVLYPFWDDLFVDANAGVFTAVVGTRPHRSFVIEWRNVSHFSDDTARLSFVAIIGEEGRVTYRYQEVSGGGLETGNSATIGVENATGTDAFQYSFNESVIAEGTGITFRTTRHGVLYGTVTDANDGLAVEGATVTVRSGADVVATTTSGADGGYIAQVLAGNLTVTAEKAAYETTTVPVTLAPSDIAERNVVMRTARVQASVAQLTIVAPAGQTRTRIVRLTNTGGIATPFLVHDDPGDVPWLGVIPTSGTLAPGAGQNLTVTVSTDGLAPGVYDANLVVMSNSGRNPTLTIPVRLVVPRYQQALDAGSAGTRIDSLGDTWGPDRAFVAGSSGYVGTTTSVRRTNRAIAGTPDPGRYTDCRVNMFEYRFDGLAPGVYTVELNFAEIVNLGPNQRVFDVIIEGALVLPSLDISLEAGRFTALNKTFTVTVTDGQMNVRFITHRGFGQPIVNAIRVTDRPDLAS